MSEERFEVVWSRARRSLNRLPEKVVVACVEFVHGGLSENLYRVGKPLRFDLEVPIVPAAATSGLSMRSMNRNARSESQRSSTGATYTDPIRPESRKPGRPLRAPGSAPASAMRREVRRSRGHRAGRPGKRGAPSSLVAGCGSRSAIPADIQPTTTVVGTSSPPNPVVPPGCRRVLHTITAGRPLVVDIYTIDPYARVATSVDGGPFRPAGWESRC